ncbi:1-(5-phosphoribosyl)-5-[(5-phosphoribosylamino)methylideneamino] imidazole-4-carboxamide isomerase [Lachnospiraceae bacterium]|nr:1-(5-phosphoribosyl)-5-[(5-phosphoribosylamino)methylideneamino] imidazole-4-carboxamide isomerase [Lachnospiraceae bacterium]
MQFRPCIDIHNGKVKQIVGSSLRDEGDTASENFVSEKGAAYYAGLYKERDLAGGHVILLNSVDSPYYEATKAEAFAALGEYRNGMQVGGGITDKNAAEFLDAGASHVIVTSFVFKDGKLDTDNLKSLQSAVGRDRIVLDLSCRRKTADGPYYVVTDRWQKFTDYEVNAETLKELSKECAEFLIHAVDVEGKGAGIDPELVRLLSEVDTIPVTYAGGVRSLADVEVLRENGKGRVNFTVGSALKFFGGSLEMDSLMEAVQ